MAVPENPSAGKFGPPQENAQRERARVDGRTSKTPQALGGALVLAGVIGLRVFAHSRPGWAAAAAVLLMAAGYVIKHIGRRQNQDARGSGPNPYTPPTNITR